MMMMMTERTAVLNPFFISYVTEEPSHKNNFDMLTASGILFSNKIRSHDPRELGGAPNSQSVMTVVPDCFDLTVRQSATVWFPSSLLQSM